ncbi:MAG TPA: ATP-binding protein, partial [Oligoflexus sp.]|uniref:ATP-binding protein n=1 Tax=Oligoflexus sp. TaxID=1971216 RepID=UPI002D4FDCE9
NLTCEIPDENWFQKPAPFGSDVGIDPGMKTIMTTSDGVAHSRENITKRYAESIAVFRLEGEDVTEQAFEDFLPEEMTLRQIPSRLKIGDRILQVQVTTVRSGGLVESLLFSIIDATNLEKAERENTRHKVLVRLLREIEAFRNFLDETRSRLELSRKLIRAGEQLKVRSELHTIKGNTAAFDLLDIAALIHNIEDHATIGIESIDLIDKEFELFLQENHEILQISFVGENQDNTLTIDQKNLDDIVVRIRETLSTDEIRTTVNDWVADMRYKQARILIGALPEYGERLASRFEKEVAIQVEGADTRMDPDVMRPIMHSLIHLVRNSIDHGLESPAERRDMGKASKGMITISCETDAEHWVVHFVDDGRGINVGRVVQKALDNGQITPEALADMSYEQKISLIFLSGISTSDNVTDISGRGVGMSAVHQAVQDAGGQLTIQSLEGRGTTIRVSIPRIREPAYRLAS